jgi:putative effector of murein hydrolase
MSISKRARIWVGATLLALIAFNYAAMGVPLYKNISSLERRTKEIMARQLESKEHFKRTDDYYVVDVLKKEIIALDRKLVVLNCVAVSVAAVIASWMAFGLVGRRDDRRKP